MARRSGCDLRGRRFVAQGIPRRRFEIIELAVACRPEERPAGQDNQREAQRHKDQQYAHGAPASTAGELGQGCLRSRFGNMRALFRMTATELIDIPAAASQGGTNPSAASGSEAKL